MTVFAQFTSFDDSSVLILYNPCLYISCMILVSVVHHLSFLLTTGLNLLILQTKNSCVFPQLRCIFSENNVPLCGKFVLWSSPSGQNRLSHMLKPPNESCETSVFSKLVPSQGRKSKNSNVNNFPSSCFKFLSELFPKFIF